MSPLWRNSKIKQLLTIKKRPSPKQNSDYPGFAQAILFCRNRRNPQFQFICDTIKGISLFTSLRQRVAAGMTVEAAIVLPMFLFFFLNLGCAIEMIRLHGNIEFALCDIGKRMTVYGYALSEMGGEQAEINEGVNTRGENENGLWDELKDVAFSYTYIKSQIVDYLGEQYLEEAPIVNGVNGLQFLESEIFDNNDCVEIVVTYEVEPFSRVMGFEGFRMANRYYGHLWNGYCISGTEDSGEREDVVYVTENGVVFHEDRNCSYLSLSVREVTLQEAYESRNVYGKKYVPCMRCKDSEVKAKVYITDEGDNIHYLKDCPGLKRTVHPLSREEAGAYRPCGRCGTN